MVKLPSSFNNLLLLILNEFIGSLVHIRKQSLYKLEQLILKEISDDQNNDDDQDHLKRADPSIVLPKAL